MWKVLLKVHTLAQIELPLRPAAAAALREMVKAVEAQLKSQTELDEKQRSVAEAAKEAALREAVEAEFFHPNWFVDKIINQLKMLERDFLVETPSSSDTMRGWPPKPPNHILGRQGEVREVDDKSDEIEDEAAATCVNDVWHAMLRSMGKRYSKAMRAVGITQVGELKFGGDDD